MVIVAAMDPNEQTLVWSISSPSTLIVYMWLMSEWTRMQSLTHHPTHTYPLLMRTRIFHVNLIFHTTLVVQDRGFIVEVPTVVNATYNAYSHGCLRTCTGKPANLRTNNLLRTTMNSRYWLQTADSP